LSSLETCPSGLCWSETLSCQRRLSRRCGTARAAAPRAIWPKPFGSAHPAGEGSQGSGMRPATSGSPQSARDEGPTGSASTAPPTTPRWRSTAKVAHLPREAPPSCRSRPPNPRCLAHPKPRPRSLPRLPKWQLLLSSRPNMIFPNLHTQMKFNTTTSGYSPTVRADATVS